MLVGGYCEKIILVLGRVLDLVDESKSRGKFQLEIAINVLLRKFLDIIGMNNLTDGAGLGFRIPPSNAAVCFRIANLQHQECWCPVTVTLKVVFFLPEEKNEHEKIFNILNEKF